MRVVLDTEVVIRGLLFPGSERSTLEALQNGQIDVLFSQEILEEYLTVLQKILPLEKRKRPMAHQVRTWWEKQTTLIQPAQYSMAGQHPGRDKFIACALSGNAEYVVTVDPEMLGLGNVGSVQFLEP